MSITAPFYFRDVIKLFGGLREVNTLLRWLNYYGVKWYKELKDAGIDRRSSHLAYVLYRSIELQGRFEAEKPSKRPTNTFLLQALDVVESFDNLGMVSVARSEVDSDVVSTLFDIFLMSEFYMFLTISMYRLFNVDKCGSVLVAYAYKGVETEILQGFNKNITVHEPEHHLPGAVKNLCNAEAECAVAIYLFLRSRTLRDDLRCLKNVKRLLVATLPLEAPPSLIAIGAAVGFTSFYRADEMSQLLKYAGFRRGKIYLKKPYYAATWTT